MKSFFVFPRKSINFNLARVWCGKKTTNTCFYFEKPSYITSSFRIVLQIALNCKIPYYVFKYVGFPFFPLIRLYIIKITVLMWWFLSLSLSSKTWGNLVDWWHPVTKDKYVKKAQCIIAQYANYTIPELGLSLNGINTQGENIADNGGIKEAYRAYSKYSYSI